MELQSISGLGPSTEESLNDIGIETIEDLANSSIEDITDCGISKSRAEDYKYSAKQNTITIQSGLEVEEEYDNKGCISTGLDELDEYTEGGLSDEEIVAAYGSDGSGKTQLGFQLAVSASLNNDSPVVWIETERSRFQPERIKQIGGEEALENIYRIKAYDLDTQLNSYKKIQDSFDNVSLVVIDSLTARFRLTNKFDERSNLSARSSELGNHINTIEDMVDRLECPCYVTCQVYNEPTQYSSGDMMWGGSLLKHSIIYRIYMKQSSGETHEVTVEAHPSTGNNSFHINIDEDGIEEI
jgi:RecA/RadA recombinase